MIFINYRKGESQPVVDNLARQLKGHFGQAAVFKDDKDLQGGERWPERLRAELARRDVLLAVVATLRAAHPLGPGWRPPLEVRRLDDGADRDTFLAHTSGLIAADPALGALLRELEGWPLAVTILAHRARYVGDLAELAEPRAFKTPPLWPKGTRHPCREGDGHVRSTALGLQRPHRPERGVPGGAARSWP
jgi:hypothetical protein